MSNDDAWEWLLEQCVFQLLPESRQRIGWRDVVGHTVPQICIKYSRFITWQSNNSKGCGHDRLPNWNPKNGGMLISQPISRCLTNHSELCMSRLLNNQPRRISIYRLQRRPSFRFESSVSSTPMTSGDPGLFQNCAAATGNSRPPMVDSLNGGIRKRFVPAERTAGRPDTSATWTNELR